MNPKKYIRKIFFWGGGESIIEKVLLQSFWHCHKKKHKEGVVSDCEGVLKDGNTLPFYM